MLQPGGSPPLGLWVPYTPTWTAPTTNPSIGNGTLLGRYQKIGPKTCAVRLYIAGGTTTSSGSGTYNFGLPFAAAAVGSQAGVGMWQSGLSLYSVVWLIAAGASSGQMWIPDGSTAQSNALSSSNGGITNGVVLTAALVYETA